MAGENCAVAPSVNVRELAELLVSDESCRNSAMLGVSLYRKNREALENSFSSSRALVELIRPGNEYDAIKGASPDGLPEPSAISGPVGSGNAFRIELSSGLLARNESDGTYSMSPATGCSSRSPS